MYIALYIFTTVLASFFFSYYFVNVALIPARLKRSLKYPPGKRMKPLDCVTCLSVWVCVALSFAPFDVSVSLCTIFMAGFIGNKIK